jgi:hypothetical protein
VIIGHEMEKTYPVFWILMQIAMFAGFLTRYSVNWWLIKKGIKKKCNYRSALVTNPHRRPDFPSHDYLPCCLSSFSIAVSLSPRVKAIRPDRWESARLSIISRCRHS